MLGCSGRRWSSQGRLAAVGVWTCGAPGKRARRIAYVEDAERSKGVAWAGLGPEPLRPRDEASIEAAARAEWLRLRAWRASAEGRFLAAMAAGQRAAERAHLAGEAARAAVASTSDPSSRCRLTAANALEAEGRALIAAARTARQAVRAVRRGPGRSPAVR